MSANIVEVVYEHGVFRPLSPILVHEGQHFSVTIKDIEEDTNRSNQLDPNAVARLLQEIAMLSTPTGEVDTGSIDHDHYLYGAPKRSEKPTE